MKTCKQCGAEKEDNQFKGRVCKCCNNLNMRTIRAKQKLMETPEEREARNAKHREYIKRKMTEPEFKQRVTKQRYDYALSRPEYSLWRRARARAIKKGLEFTITEEDIVIPKFCPIFGIEMQLGGDSYNSPSIDRIDSSKGYTKDNIMIICYRANTLKNDATPKEIAMLNAFYSTFIEDT